MSKLKTIKSIFLTWKGFALVHIMMDVVFVSSTAYLGAMITMIEKQFGLSSSHTGLIFTSERIGHLLCMFPVAYIGRKWNLPKLITAMYSIIGVMLVIMGTTRFILPSNDIPLTNISASKRHQQFCTSTNIENINKQHDENMVAMIVFCTAILIIGAVSVPKYTLLPAYLDDITPKHSLPLVFGLSMGISTFGSLIASGTASWCNTVFVSLQATFLTPTDPAWIGAWWIGFFGFGCLTLLFAPLFLVFAKQGNLTDKSEHQTEKESFSDKDITGKRNQTNRFDENNARHILAKSRNTHTYVTKSEINDKAQNLDALISSSKQASGNLNNASNRELLVIDTLVIQKNKRQAIKDVFKVLWRLTTNKFIVGFLLIRVLFSFNDSGPWMFMLKYFINQFQVPEWKINIFFGVGEWATISISAVLGGFLASKLRLTFRGGALLCVVCMSVVTALRVGAIFVHCDESSVLSTSNTSQLRITCSNLCNCSLRTFTPVCDRGYIYTSACHAGCSENYTVISDQEEPKKMYTDCSCTTSGFAVDGLCATTCPLITALFIIVLLPMFFRGISEAPTAVNILRSVDKRDKAIALATINLAMNLFGDMTGAPTTGTVIDSTCLIWGENEVGNQSNCFVYDNNKYRWRLLGIMLGVVLSITLLYFWLWYMTCNEEVKITEPDRNIEENNDSCENSVS